MSFETFLDTLHFHTDQAAPEGWEVNWEDAPLPYKLYRHLPTIPLSSEIPFSLENIETSNNINLGRIGHLLFYTYGLTNLCQLGMQVTEQDTIFTERYRRFIPSGGGLYPNELYVYLKLEELPSGVYHYDVAHHRLILLREGNFDSYVSRALGNRYDVSTSFATVFISTMFWKNFFKYHNFSYRLQGLDAGVLIGQFLEVAKRFKFHSSVHYQFLDRAVNHLLGLSESEESVYVVIPLGEESNQTELDRTISAEDLCHEIPKIDHQHYVRSKHIVEYPMLLKMNEAAFLDSTQAFQNSKRKQSIHPHFQAQMLPRVERMSYNFAEACRSRYSPEMDFTFKQLSKEELIHLLNETAASFPYRNDVTANDVSLYLSIVGIEGIQNGAYFYNSQTHSLQPIQLGDYRLLLQNAMKTHNLSLIQVPICVHIVGERQHAKEELGYRGYRIQQMEAGILSQKLLLAAAAIGLGGHPLLGYDVNTCDNLYRLKEQGKTTLIQIPIGFYEERAWLKGSLHS